MSLSESIDLFAIVAFLGAVGWAVASDVQRRMIPNLASLTMVLLFVLHAATSPASVNWWGSIAIAFGAFAIGLPLYMMRLVGGGDVKFFAAAALWAGPVFAPHYLAITVFVAALLGLAMFFGLRVSNARRWSTGGDVAQFLHHRATLAHGIAIGTGAVFLAVAHAVPLIA